MAAQNNAIRTNHIKARIDKIQQNSKCRQCGDRDKTINYIISECSKLVQKEYKTRHDWVSKVIHWEMCKKFEFDHTNKWYMHNPAPVQENNTQKLLWDFDIHTDHLISTRRPDLIIINKKKRTCKTVDFSVPADHGIKLKEYEKKDKYLDLPRELKKLWNMKVTIVPIVIGAFGTATNWIEKTEEYAGDNYINCNWCVWNSNKMITKGTGVLGSWRTSGDHSNCYIIENRQNTEKSPGDLKIFAVFKTPLKNHLLTLMWKTLISK